MDRPIVLIVKELVTKFYTLDGIVHAVNGVSCDLEKRETLAIVGESGSGKSVTMMSVLGLIPSPPGKIENGEALFSTATTGAIYSNCHHRNCVMYEGGR